MSPITKTIAGIRETVIAAHPRTGFKTGMIEALLAGMRDKPETAFGPKLALRSRKLRDAWQPP